MILDMIFIILGTLNYPRQTVFLNQQQQAMTSVRSTQQNSPYLAFTNNSFSSQQPPEYVHVNSNS